MKIIKNYEDYLNERFTKTGPASDSEIAYDYEDEFPVDIEDEEELTGEIEGERRIGLEGVDDEISKLSNNLENLEIGDRVIHTGDSSFCHTSEEEITDVTIKYDENTGKPFKVLHIGGGQKFDSRSGSPLSPPWAYYIKTIK